MSSLRSLLYREFKIITRKPILPIFTLVTPLTYLLIFAPVLESLIGGFHINGVFVSYLEYNIPGILSLLTINICVLGTVATLFFDRRTGMLEFLFGNPITPTMYLTARYLTSIFYNILQGFFLLAIAYIFTSFQIGLGQAIMILASLVVVTLFYSSLMIITASLIFDQDAFNGLISLLLPPLIFGSTIFYPEEQMFESLKYLSAINPITYTTEFTRSLYMEAYSSHYVLVVPALSVVFILLSFKIFTRSETYILRE